MECDKKCFTVTWRIENYDFSLLSPGLETPEFFIDSVQDTSWKFRIEPELKNGHFLLFCNKNTKVPETISRLEIEVSIFYGSDYSPWFEKSFNDIVILSGEIVICGVPYSKIYVEEENELYVHKTCTIRFKMCGTSESSLEVGKCFIRTRMRVERTAFMGFVENFSRFSRQKKSLSIKSAAAESPLFTSEVSLVGDFRGSERVWIEIIPLKKDHMKFCVCKLFLLDIGGEKKLCTRSEILFDKDQPQEWKFPLSFTKDYLMRKNLRFLFNDALTLKFEIAFTTGIEYEQIEDSEFGILVTENRPVLPCGMDELARLYEEGMFCDMKLETETETFNAHKNILGARSQVFKSMFITDTREKGNDVVYAEDLEADSVRRMLRFLYSDKVDDLDFESAQSLYLAAEKYNIAGLKHICSLFLKDSLQPSNCCEILLLAEKYHDEYLKKIVQEFMSYHREEVFRCSEWADFSNTHPKLSVKILHAVYLGI